MQGRRGKTGDPRENPPTSGMVRHDSHMRKSGGDPAGYGTRFALVGGEQANRSATAAPARLRDKMTRAEEHSNGTRGPNIGIRMRLYYIATRVSALFRRLRRRSALSERGGERQIPCDDWRVRAKLTILHAAPTRRTHSSSEQRCHYLGWLVDRKHLPAALHEDCIGPLELSRYRHYGPSPNNILFGGLPFLQSFPPDERVGKVISRSGLPSRGGVLLPAGAREMGWHILLRIFEIRNEAKTGGGKTFLLGWTPAPKVKKRGSDTGDTNTQAYCLIAHTRKACSVSVTLYCANYICNSGILLPAKKNHRLNYAHIAEDGDARWLWSSAGLKGGGNGRSPRKPAAQRHRPARFSHAYPQGRLLDTEPRRVRYRSNISFQCNMLNTVYTWYGTVNETIKCALNSFTYEKKVHSKRWRNCSFTFQYDDRVTTESPVVTCSTMSSALRGDGVLVPRASVALIAPVLLVQRHDGNTARLARRSDKVMGVLVSVAQTQDQRRGRRASRRALTHGADSKQAAFRNQSSSPPPQGAVSKGLLNHALGGGGAGRHPRPPYALGRILRQRASTGNNPPLTTTSVDASTEQPRVHMPTCRGAVQECNMQEEQGDPRENPQTSSIVRYDSHARESRDRPLRESNPVRLGIEARDRDRQEKHHIPSELETGDWRRRVCLFELAGRGRLGLRFRVAAIYRRIILVLFTQLAGTRCDIAAFDRARPAFQLNPGNQHDGMYILLTTKDNWLEKGKLGTPLVGSRPIRKDWYRSDHSFQDKIDVKHVYTKVDFAIGLQLIRHALDDSEPITDVQVNKPLRIRQHRHGSCVIRVQTVNTCQKVFQPIEVVERLDYSPPTKRQTGFNPRPGHYRIFAYGNRAGQSRLSAGFLGDSGAAPYSTQSPSSALKTPQVIGLSRCSAPSMRQGPSPLLEVSTGLANMQECSVEIGKFREFNDLEARLHSLLYTRASDVCPLAAHLAVRDSLLVSLHVCYWLRVVQGVYRNTLIQLQKTSRQRQQAVLEITGHGDQPISEPSFHTANSLSSRTHSVFHTQIHARGEKKNEALLLPKSFPSRSRHRAEKRTEEKRRGKCVFVSPVLLTRFLTLDAKLQLEPMRVKRDEYGAEPECNTITACENPGVIWQGIEPSSHWWEASSLTPTPPRCPDKSKKQCVCLYPDSHALDDSAPIADLQGNKKRILYCQMWGNTGATANEQTSEGRLYKGLWSLAYRRLVTVTLNCYYWLKRFFTPCHKYSQPLRDVSSTHNTLEFSLLQENSPNFAAGTSGVWCKCCKISRRLLGAVHTRRTQRETVAGAETGETKCTAATRERATRHPFHACYGVNSTTNLTHSDPVYTTYLSIYGSVHQNDETRSLVKEAQSVRMNGTKLCLASVSDRNEIMLTSELLKSDTSHCADLKVWDRGRVVVRQLASDLSETGLIPGGLAPGYSHVEIVPDDATGRRVFSGISRFPPPLYSGAAQYSLLFTLIGSKVIVKSRPNHYTHSLTLQF
ncbi:hypothetical protein PR048_033575 [Dryococelus australis]|uniref:Uncharacterized protein n=1 Tax=Dryococelus australis TaxID=614101 RepID=A0ABQ9G3H6_9NEOP|nr:hypothetical protein PR048_033575 [Dryococelus australis]